MKCTPRIRWSLSLAALWLMLYMPGQWARAAEPLRIGLTPIFLNERHGLLAEWRAYMERKTGQPVAFVLRDSYQETMELLQTRSIQAAWLCDCPHVTANPEFRLLATPLFQGRPYYRAYLIVPEEDRSTRSIQDMKDKVFAYADPYSHVGYLNPRHEIKKQGGDPDRFFRRVFFAHSHRNAIEAVASGIADAASVNSYIWETMDRQAPALTGKTRIAARSEEFGFPPLVTGRTLPSRTYDALQQALLQMAADPQGKEILDKMNLDGFSLPRPEIYRPVQEIVRSMKDK